MGRLLEHITAIANGTWTLHNLINISLVEQITQFVNFVGQNIWSSDSHPPQHFFSLTAEAVQKDVTDMGD